MDVKSKVILEIDDLLSEYTEKRNTPRLPRGGDGGFHTILGAIDALASLKSDVEDINVNRYETMRIVEEPSEDFLTLRPATSFLSEVLLRIEFTLEDRSIGGHAGSGANPNAMPGREEACMRIKRFVYDLHDELADN